MPHVRSDYQEKRDTRVGNLTNSEYQFKYVSTVAGILALASSQTSIFRILYLARESYWRLVICYVALFANAVCSFKGKRSECSICAAYLVVVRHFSRNTGVETRADIFCQLLPIRTILKYSDLTNSARTNRRNTTRESAGKTELRHTTYRQTNSCNTTTYTTTKLEAAH
ncbi:Hypothetical_protein [Hexamita inflata]|uniref:Hypothetical_protein n=1 Tax=Hexamita inflata TaxID=28002 RepID=A0AA86UWW7_9EUKA|nr:Hypothetical protein HINF_LOCUS62865 [Hexamita inflata]